MTISALDIRALRAHDPFPLLIVHAGLSEQSRELRYHTPTPRLTRSMLRLLTRLRPGHHEAYAAWQGTRPVGIVRWARLHADPGHEEHGWADLALEVVDTHQGSGVGRALAARAARAAVAAGVHAFVVDVPDRNVVVQGWLRALGARRDPGVPDRFHVDPRRLAQVAPATAPGGGSW